MQPQPLCEQKKENKVVQEKKNANEANVDEFELAFQPGGTNGGLKGGGAKSSKKNSKVKQPKSQKEIDKELRRYFDRGRADDFDEEYVKAGAEQSIRKGGAKAKKKGRRPNGQNMQSGQVFANANVGDNDSEDKEDAKFEALLRDYNNAGKKKK